MKKIIFVMLVLLVTSKMCAHRIRTRGNVQSQGNQVPVSPCPSQAPVSPFSMPSVTAR